MKQIPESNHLNKTKTKKQKTKTKTKKQKKNPRTNTKTKLCTKFGIQLSKTLVSSSHQWRIG
jgi:hypothetical protein